MGLGLLAALLCAFAVLPASIYGIAQLTCWITFTVLVGQDLKRTRMSRAWAFFTFFCGLFTLTLYLYTRNSRGYRTYAAPIQ